ncbi:MAG: hypothetical protein ACREP3_19110 [Candidatus Binatia bacterium]
MELTIDADWLGGIGVQDAALGEFGFHNVLNGAQRLSARGRISLKLLG